MSGVRFPPGAFSLFSGAAQKRDCPFLIGPVLTMAGLHPTLDGFGRVISLGAPRGVGSNGYSICCVVFSATSLLWPWGTDGS